MTIDKLMKDISRMETRSLKRKRLQEGLKDIKKENKKRKDNAEDIKERALQVQEPNAKGKRGDGSLHIGFLQMGQGDCTLISTPGGKIIMIDCGSDKMYELNGKDETEDLKRLRDVIQNPKFLGSQKKIDILILTHPDRDHYNRLPQLLDEDVKFDKIYHSFDFYEYSNFRKINDEEDTPNNSWLTQRVDTDKIVQVEIEDINDDPIKILEETDLKINIIAGGLIEFDDFNDDIQFGEDHIESLKNRASIVTLIECGKNKIMICGDATKVTERFMMKKYKDKIKNLTLIQAGHHGSLNTSSIQEFVDHVATKKVIFSAAAEKDGKLSRHGLPYLSTVQRYVSALKDENEKLHTVYCWKHKGYPKKSFLHDFKHEKVETKKSAFGTGSWIGSSIDFKI